MAVHMNVTYCIVLQQKGHMNRYKGMKNSTFSRTLVIQMNFILHWVYSKMEKGLAHMEYKENEKWK